MGSTPRSHWEVFWPPWVPSRPLAAFCGSKPWQLEGQTVSIDLRKVRLICEPGLESTLSNMEVFRRFGALPSLPAVEARRHLPCLCPCLSLRVDCFANVTSALFLPHVSVLWSHNSCDTFVTYDYMIFIWYYSKVQ
jgi:hypothetical protein